MLPAKRYKIPLLCNEQCSFLHFVFILDRDNGLYYSLENSSGEHNKLHHIMRTKKIVKYLIKTSTLKLNSYG